MCTSSLAIVQIPFVQAQIDPSNPKLNEPKQMVAHLGELPGLINADGSGPFVELVRYMDKVDPDTEIHIEVFPLHRAVHGVVNKQADFALPAIYVDDPEGKLPFRFSTKSFGLVAHVLYTNKANRITSEQLWSQPDKYYVEAVPSYIPFEVARSNSINASRQHFADFKDVFVIAHGSKGDEVDQYLTRILSQLEESGELKILYDAIHRPYDDWQP
nr:ABC transporter substrate-binding protein [Vibrio anguillarum]